MPAVANLPEDADPTTRRRRGIAGWLGLDTEDALNENVYSAQIVGGMTGDQILASMNIPVRPRGVGDAGQLNYAAIDPDEKLNTTERNYWYSEVITQDYEPILEARIEELRKAEAGASIEEKEEFMKEIDKLEELRTGDAQVRLPELIKLFGVTDLTRGYFETYGTRLFSPEFGFNPLVMDKFKPVDDLEGTGGDAIPDTDGVTTPEEGVITVRTEAEIQPAVEEFVEANPTATEVTISGPDGVRVIPLGLEETDEEGWPGPGSGSLAGVITEFFTRERNLKVPENAPGATVIPNRLGDNSTAPQGIMSRGPSALQPPEVPADMPDDEFTRMIEEEVLPSQRRVLDEARTPRYPEPSPTLGASFQGRPSIVKVLLENPDMPIDPDLVETVFEDLGYRADTTFGNRLANMLSRDFKPEERKIALEFLMNQYSLFEDRP